MSFSSVWVFVPASTLEWAHRFSGKGFWLAQPSSPSPRRCFSGKWGPISQGMTLPKAHLFCFFLHLCCFLAFFFFLFFCAFLLFFFGFLPQFFSDFFQKVSSFGGPQFGSGTFPFGWPAVHLAGVPQHCAFFGFTGSPRTSLFKFNVSLCFLCLLRRFCHLVQVNLLFPCVLHLAFSLFPGCISSVYILHISCRLLPTCIGYFHVFFICQMCPFPSCICSFYFSSICNFCLFPTCMLLSHFFCNCHVCPFQICIFQFHFFCIVSPFFQDVNILEQAQFDSTRLTKKLFLGFLPIYNKCFWQIVPTTCLGA